MFVLCLCTIELELDHDGYVGRGSVCCIFPENRKWTEEEYDIRRFYHRNLFNIHGKIMGCRIMDDQWMVVFHYRLPWSPKIRKRNVYANCVVLLENTLIDNPNALIIRPGHILPQDDINEPDILGHYDRDDVLSGIRQICPEEKNAELWFEPEIDLNGPTWTDWHGKRHEKKQQPSQDWGKLDVDEKRYVVFDDWFKCAKFCQQEENQCSIVQSPDGALTCLVGGVLWLRKSHRNYLISCDEYDTRRPVKVGDFVYNKLGDFGQKLRVERIAIVEANETCDLVCSCIDQQTSKFGLKILSADNCSKMPIYS